MVQWCNPLTLVLEQSSGQDLSPVQAPPLPGGGGGTWSTNIRRGTAGKSANLPFPAVKFLKMIACPGVNFS